MLESLACRSVDPGQRRVFAAAGLSTNLDKTLNGDKSNGNKESKTSYDCRRIQLVRVKSNNYAGASQRVPVSLQHLLLVSLFFAGIIVKCGESRSAACFCQNRFYRECPDLEVCRASNNGVLATTKSDTHEISHPDHLGKDSMDSTPFGSGVDEDEGLTDPLDDMKVSSLNPNSLGATSVVNLGDAGIASARDRETVEFHRKVYVSDRMKDREPIIHPLSITIPVEMEPPATAVLPPPKPVFKLRKYTYHESQPQVEMVPVTTTIIKPVGVTPDQYIENKKLE